MYIIDLGIYAYIDKINKDNNFDLNYINTNNSKNKNVNITITKLYELNK